MSNALRTLRRAMTREKQPRERFSRPRALPLAGGKYRQQYGGKSAAALDRARWAARVERESGWPGKVWAAFVRATKGWWR